MRPGRLEKLLLFLEQGRADGLCSYFSLWRMSQAPFLHTHPAQLALLFAISALWFWAFLSVSEGASLKKKQTRNKQIIQWVYDSSFATIKSIHSQGAMVFNTFKSISLTYHTMTKAMGSLQGSRKDI